MSAADPTLAIAAYLKAEADSGAFPGAVLAVGRHGRLALLAALFVQLYDTKLLLTFRNLSYGSYETPLDDKSWTAIMDQFDDIAFYPPFESHQLTKMDYQYFCFLAAKA